MLSLEYINKIILEEGEWKTYDLLMTVDGFKKFEEQLVEYDKKQPQIYVHVGAESNIDKVVLRIGKAENGIYKRWVTAKDGHFSTFSWAIGNSDQYGSQNAGKYPQYLLFFANLFNKITKVHILTCPPNISGKHLARACEQILIGSYSPIWEKISKNLIIYAKENKNLGVSRFGNAIKIFNDSSLAPPNIAEYLQKEDFSVFK